jgi:iron complex outermembrane receptor protein
MYFIRKPRLHHGPRLVGLAMVILARSGYAEDSNVSDASSDLFQLGAIYVSAETQKLDQVASNIDQASIQQFNRYSVGDALNLLSGVTLANNNRNEQLIYVRGFDAREVPLFLDGIPIYVPYDGYIDFNRFLTADIAAIQVAKGFSSINYGPNTLGGAINLVSKRPQQKLEGDLSVGFGESQLRQTAVNVGSNQGLWYLQASAAFMERDGFRLSSDFEPTTTENGGLRNNAYSKDNKFSIKFGYTPTSSDEHSLSYSRQEGEKGNPPMSASSTSRYWKWPYWDKESLYYIANMSLSRLEQLKIRGYYDRYDNKINSYTNDQYTTLKSSGSGSVSTGHSIYNDRVKGGSLTLQSNRFKAQQLSLVGHYKIDTHKERDGNNATNTHFEDKIWSLGLEDNLQLRPNILLSLGYSHHHLSPETVYSAGNPYHLPDAQTANDAQIGLFYQAGIGTQLYATLAKKTRLPSLKDRYSQRLGSYIENPALKAEQALNYELGIKTDLNPATHLEAALFYSDIDDKIQSVANVQEDLSQMQNVGQVRITGVELSFKLKARPYWTLGANYTYMDLDNLSASAKITDIPAHKFFGYSQFAVLPHWQLQIDLETNSSRWDSDTIQLSGYEIFNLQLSYQQEHAHHPWRISFGVNNLSDEDYALADGFPSSGRMWFANAKWSF